MTRVLVTGAGGFIGTHLVETLLHEGLTVRALHHSTSLRAENKGHVEVVYGDVRDEVTMKEVVSDVDIIFHLAAKVNETSEPDKNGDQYDSVNVRGTLNLVRAALSGRVLRFVFFSSVKALGEWTQECVDEMALPKPETPYGRSKLEAERQVFEYGAIRGLPVVCLRLPLVYGPGQRGKLAQMIKAIDQGFFPPLPELGNRRSMIHVSNVVGAAMLASMSPAATGQCYIVTDARPYSTRELYEMIARSLGKRIPRWSIPPAVLHTFAGIGDLFGHVSHQRSIFDSKVLAKLTKSASYSPSKIIRELGYRPVMSFEDALPELIAWYRASRA